MFVVTVVAAGPRAWAVARGRWQALQRSAPKGAQVDLDRVGFVSLPEWLRGDTLTAVSLDLATALRGRVGLLDDRATTLLRSTLQAVPWVRDIHLHRVYPDRLRVELTLRAPLIRLEVAGQRDVACDRDGVCLPCPPRSELPSVLAQVTAPPADVVLGRPHPDPAVRAAAAVAAEWGDHIADVVPGLPPLRQVDVSNLGYAADPTRLCEVRVAVQRADGKLVWFDYDHPVGSEAPRVEAATKAGVLRQLLAAHPGLVGVAAADLRFAKRWQAWVVYETGDAAPP